MRFDAEGKCGLRRSGATRREGGEETEEIEKHGGREKSVVK